MGHILFFENLFPEYEVVVDELMAEGDRIFVRSHFVGTHLGFCDGIPPTGKEVKSPFALGYEVHDEEIVDFWAIANEAELFEQMGLTKDQLEVH
ncbi:MAG: ester cyclase [Saprospirales bacterium]|nr:ester cyclase [Saprospirales bacterium]